MKDRWNYWILFVFFSGGAVREVITKLILDVYPPEVVSTVAALIAVVSVILFYLSGKQRYNNAVQEENWTASVFIWMGALSLSTASAVFFGNIAIDRIGPLAFKLVDVIVYPLSLSFLAFLILREMISRQVIFSTLIALVGFYVFYAGRITELTLGWAGMAAGGLSALSYAISLMIVKRLLSQNIIPEKIVAARFLLLSLCAFFVVPGKSFEFSWQTGFLLLLLGILGYAGLFTMFFYGVKDIPATTVNVFVASTPLFSALFSWLLLPDVRYSVVEMIGLLIIILALGYMLVVRDPSQTSPPSHQKPMDSKNAGFLVK